MVSLFLQKVVAEKPALIGETIYLNHSATRRDIPCFLNNDGSLSLVAEPDLSFLTPTAMVEFCGKSGSADAEKDLFLEPKRKFSLKYFMTGKRMRIELNESLLAPTTPAGGRRGQRHRTLHCNGFALKFPTANKLAVKPEDKQAGNVWKSIKCLSRYSVIRGRAQSTCSNCKVVKASATADAKALMRKQLLCTGLARENFDDTIKRREWDGRRREVSLAAFYGDRFFSISCDGSKLKTQPFRCDMCSRLSRTLGAMKSKDRRRDEKAKQVESRGDLSSNPGFSSEPQKLLEEQRQSTEQVTKETIDQEAVNHGENGESEIDRSMRQVPEGEIDQSNELHPEMEFKQEHRLSSTAKEDAEKEQERQEKIVEAKKAQQQMKAAIDKKMRDMYQPLIAKAIEYQKKLRAKNQSATATNQNLSISNPDNGENGAVSINID